MKKGIISSLLVSVALAIGHGGAALASDVTVEEMQAELDAATPEQPADFSGHDLSQLDLSGMNMSGVNLAGADLSNARLENTNFEGANLLGADLDGAWLIGANFANANLQKVHLFGPVVARGLEPSAEQSPVFAGANLAGARVIAKLSRGDASGSDFSSADLGADMKNQSMGLMRFEAEGADLSEADFSNARLNHALLRFADLTNADFSNADLRNVEFNGAKLSGANFAGADATGADFSGADLSEAAGLDSATGIAVDNAG